MSANALNEIIPNRAMQLVRPAPAYSYGRFVLRFVPLLIAVFACVVSLGTPNHKSFDSVDDAKNEMGDILERVLVTMFVVCFVVVGLGRLTFSSLLEVSLGHLWENLLNQLPPGVFMISYSSMANRSSFVASRLALQFSRSVCWLDANELLPGELMFDSRAQAVRNSLVRFVFLSPLLIKRPEYRLELAEILRQPERAIVFVDNFAEPPPPVDTTPGNKSAENANDTTRTGPSKDDNNNPSSSNDVDVVSGEIDNRTTDNMQLIGNIISTTTTDNSSTDNNTDNNNDTATDAPANDGAEWTIEKICEQHKFAAVYNVDELGYLTADRQKFRTFVLARLLETGLLKTVFRHTSPVVNARWHEYAAAATNQPRNYRSLVLGSLAVFLLSGGVCLAQYFVGRQQLGLPVLGTTDFFPLGAVFLVVPFTTAFFVLVRWLAHERKSELVAYPPIVSLLVILRKLGLCDQIKVHARLTAKNVWATALLEMLTKHEVVELVQQEEQISADTVVIAEVDKVQKPGPQQAVYLCEKFSDVTQAERVNFAGHLIQETTISRLALCELVAIRILIVGLHGAKLVTGDVSYEYHKNTSDKSEKFVRPGFSGRIVKFLLCALFCFFLSLTVSQIVVSDQKYVIINTNRIKETDAVVIKHNDFDLSHFSSAVTTLSLDQTKGFTKESVDSASVLIIRGWNRPASVERVQPNEIFSCTYDKSTASDSCIAYDLSSASKMLTFDGWSGSRNLFYLSNAEIVCTYNQTSGQGLFASVPYNKISADS